VISLVQEPDKESMSYYPLFLELKGERVLVIGGGSVAQRKVEAMLSCGASIELVSRDLSPRLKALVESRKIKYLGERFREEHLEGAFLAIAATDDKRLNRMISEAARKKGMLINVVDQPSDCNFIVPSIVRRGDLLIAVSTSGKSPALAKAIRMRLEKEFGPEYETFVSLMGELRKQILSMGLSQDENTRIFTELVHSDLLDALACDDLGRAESILRHILPESLSVKAVIDGLRDE